jgi:NADH dehydrogenase
LVEQQHHVLASFPRRLRDSAQRQLEVMGVEVLWGLGVTSATSNHIVLSDRRTIPTHTIVWAAGIRASSTAELLGVPLNHAGRVSVHPTMAVIGHDNIYVVGNKAHLEDSAGRPYPMRFPLAKQQGMLAAQSILRRISGQPEKRLDYRGLKDRGSMATIGVTGR